VSLAVTNTGTLADPAPKLKLDQSGSGNAGTILSVPGAFTLMVWAHYIGGAGVTYRDILAVRDSSVSGSPGTDQIVGVSRQEVGGVGMLNNGDVDSDAVGGRLPDNEWHHITFTGEVVPTSQVLRLTSYLDGVVSARSSDTEMLAPVFPNPSCWIQLFNSRSSESDGTGVFIGYMAALKIWNNVALTPDEIRQEMWSYLPVRTKDIFAVNPLASKESAATDLVHPTGWTVQGVDFATGALEPPGVSWAPTWRTRDVSRYVIPASAALSGTALDSCTEADVVAGGQTIVVTLTGDTFIAAT
jgi:hypothetical protein